MDYEKAYKEKYERARLLYTTTTANEYKQVVEFLFPDIGETDDEKIWSEILIYLDWIDGRKGLAPKGEYSIKVMKDWIKRRKPSNTKMTKNG